MLNRQGGGGVRLTTAQARWLALAALAGVAGLQAVISVGCNRHPLVTYLESLAFIAVPLLPALVTLVGFNPLRSVGASLCFAPLLLIAYESECLTPYQGGGASMVYVGVFLGGFPFALIGALCAPWLFRLVGIQVEKAPPAAG